VCFITGYNVRIYIHISIYIYTHTRKCMYVCNRFRGIPGVHGFCLACSWRGASSMRSMQLRLPHWSTLLAPVCMYVCICVYICFCAKRRQLRLPHWSTLLAPICMCVHMYVCMYVCMYVWIFRRIHACMHACICIHKYFFDRIQRRCIFRQDALESFFKDKNMYTCMCEFMYTHKHTFFIHIHGHTYLFDMIQRRCIFRQDALKSLRKTRIKKNI
jgi:hypothetical protein